MGNRQLYLNKNFNTAIFKNKFPRDHVKKYKLFCNYAW